MTTTHMESELPLMSDADETVLDGVTDGKIVVVMD